MSTYIRVCMLGRICICANIHIWLSARRKYSYARIIQLFSFNFVFFFSILLLSDGSGNIISRRRLKKQKLRDNTYIHVYYTINIHTYVQTYYKRSMYAHTQLTLRRIDVSQILLFEAKIIFFNIFY